MILNTLSSTRQDALQASANSVAKFYEEQIRLAALGKSDSYIVVRTCTYDFVNGGNKPCVEFNDGKVLAFGTISSGVCSNGMHLSNEKAGLLGLNTSDYNLSDSYVCWDANGKVTVTLKGNSSGGKFKGLTANSD